MIISGLPVTNDSGKTLMFPGPGNTRPKRIGRPTTLENVAIGAGMAQGKWAKVAQHSTADGNLRSLMCVISV
jgi:hypothetical protein